MSRTGLRFLLALATLGAQPAVAEDASPVSEQSRFMLTDLIHLASDITVPRGAVLHLANLLAPGITNVPAQLVKPAFKLDEQAVAGGAKVGMVPIEMVAAQSGVLSGEDLALLHRAQPGGNARVLLVSRGRVTLAELQMAVAQSEASNVLTRDGDSVVAHAPLVIWSDATLALGPDETLLLDRAAGAFVLNLGRLTLNGSKVASTASVNVQQPTFRPFLLTAAPGSADLDNSTLAHLGIAGSHAMGGVTFAGSGLYNVRAPSSVRTSLFQDVGLLALIRTSEIDIGGNRFVGAAGPAILVEGGDKARLVGNIVGGSSVSHGIKLASGADSVVIESNVVVDSQDDGIFVDDGATRIVLTGNLLAGNRGSGISIARSACVAIARNTLVQNGAKGISIVHSIKVATISNVVLDNRGAGISVANQDAGATTVITGNVFARNKVGLAGLTFASLSLDGNDFDGQTPRLLAGELVQHTRLLLASMVQPSGTLAFSGGKVAVGTKPVAFRPINLERCLKESD